MASSPWRGNSRRLAAWARAATAARLAQRELQALAACWRAQRRGGAVRLFQRADQGGVHCHLGSTGASRSPRPQSRESLAASWEGSEGRRTRRKCWLERVYFWACWADGEACNNKSAREDKWRSERNMKRGGRIVVGCWACEALPPSLVFSCFPRVGAGWAGCGDRGCPKPARRIRRRGGCLLHAWFASRIIGGREQGDAGSGWWRQGIGGGGPGGCRRKTPSTRYVDGHGMAGHDL